MARENQQQGQRNTIARVLAAGIVILAGSIALFVESIVSDGAIPPPSPRHLGSSSRRRRLNLWDLLGFRDPKSVASKTFETTRAGEGPGGRQLIHVFNPYDKGDRNLFSPVGYDEWMMLASVRSAQRAYNSRSLQESSSALFHSVTIVCAVLEHDLEPLDRILERYCDHVSVLTRTTATENHSFLRPLPFLQDIIDAGASVAGGDDYYLMLANADNSATEGFYSFVERTMRERGANSLSFNRKTLSFKLIPLLGLVEEREHQLRAAGGEMIASDEIESASWPGGYPITPDSPFEEKDNAANGFVEQARALMMKNKGNVHPGHGCFVMHSSVSRSISLGEMLPGYPGWGFHLWVMLTIMAQGYTAIGSDRLGTFHVGDAGAWREAESNTTFWQNYELEELRNIYWCPFVEQPPKSVHWLQQYINCGRIFRPASPGGGVPAFVRPGYEQIFLENFSRVLVFEDGIPFTVRHNAKSRQKMQWLPEYGVTLESTGDEIPADSNRPGMDGPGSAVPVPGESGVGDFADGSGFDNGADVGGPALMSLEDPK